MSVYFIGDPHLGHKNIAKFRPWISSTYHNTALFKSQWESTITKRDVVYMMGDVAFDYASLDLIGNLPGRKILIKGNHDDFVLTSRQCDVFEEIHGMLKYKGMWLVHAPIHPDEIRGRKGVVHGHVHMASIKRRTWYGAKVLDKRYFNTCVDVLYPQSGSMFASLEQIKNYFGT